MNDTSTEHIFTLESIRSRLSAPDDSVHLKTEEGSLTTAAVAMLLKGSPVSEIFFIVRALHENDPWSGDIGFPGGKIEHGESPRIALERETREEIGVDLRQTRLLGTLEPIKGAHLPVEIHCLVYQVARELGINRNHEISEHFWISIEDLLDPARYGDYEVRFGNERLVRPGIRVRPTKYPILWGITYRLLEQFFLKNSIQFPPNPLKNRKC